LEGESASKTEKPFIQNTTPIPQQQSTPPLVNKHILEELLINNEQENEQKPVDAMHTFGKIGSIPAKIVIDSGAVSNIVSHNSLKKIDWKIQRPSNVNLVGINEHKARALGEVIDLPITIGSQELKVDALVTEKGDYDLILGNNWMHQHKAIMD